MRALCCALFLSSIIALASDPKTGPALPPCPSADDKPDVAALLKRTEQTLDGSSSITVMAMKITTPAWARTLKLKVWAKGRDLALVRVQEGGPRETGMMTLKREKQLWNYLPQAARVMKLPSGMLGDSWLGSDFTNDDLVKGSSIVDDFTAQVDSTAAHEDRPAWHVTLVPKASATVVWDKIEMVLDRETCVPLEERFYDDQGKVARRMTFSALKHIGWRVMPSKVVITPAEAGRQTILTYEQQEFDVDIPDDTFSLNRLQQGR